jgi:hypothetical protein
MTNKAKEFGRERYVTLPSVLHFKQNSCVLYRIEHYNDIKPVDARPLRGYSDQSAISWILCYVIISDRGATARFLTEQCVRLLCRLLYCGGVTLCNMVER